MMNFEIQPSPVDIHICSIENLISYDHGCIILHPREIDGSPIWTYGIEQYADYEKSKKELQQKLENAETP